MVKLMEVIVFLIKVMALGCIGYGVSAMFFDFGGVYECVRVENVDEDN